MDDRLYFRQLLSGRDFAVDDGLAHQMVNFVYAIGDRATGQAVLVDPAYDTLRAASTCWKPTAWPAPACWPPTTTPTMSAAT